MLTRAEKRRQERQATKKQATYTLTQAQIDQLKHEASMAATKRAFLIMLGFPMLALRDTEKYGKKRMNRFVDKVLAIYDAYEKKYLSLEDLHKTIAEETGVSLANRIPK